ncbi:putative adaptor protein complex, sigma subunit [Helianthus annuus]|nr:putative adaptor protein complex, sigma subunit [Helianthus annuus]
MVVASSIYSLFDMHFYVTDICIKVIQELSGMILTPRPKLCNIVEWRGFKVVYRRYAGLYFCMCVNHEDNELEILEIIQYFVETLNRYFGSVCELDLIFHFHQTYYILE